MTLLILWGMIAENEGLKDNVAACLDLARPESIGEQATGDKDRG